MDLKNLGNEIFCRKIGMLEGQDDLLQKKEDLNRTLSHLWLSG